MQRVRDGAAAAIHDLANATVSADLLAHAKTLTEALLVLRALETRHAALRDEVTPPKKTASLFELR